MSVEGEPNNYGVDLAMGPLGDLVVTSAGDLATVGAVQVVAQALLLRFRTAVGELPLHPQYGTELPIGSKMDATAVAAALNGELAVIIQDDPRIRSAVITEVEWPEDGNYTAMAISVLVTTAGGETFEATGLPAEVRVGQVTLEGNVVGESELTPFEEQPYFAGETQTEEIEAESEIDSIVNDLPTTGG